LIGGAAAMVVVWAAAAVQARRGHSDERAPTADRPARPSAPPGISALLRSDIGVWSLLRTLLVVIAVTVGYWLTDDLDPFWTVIALLIVFQPDLQQTIFKATQRGLGTLAGAATAAALIGATSSEPAIGAASLVGAFGAVAFYQANYLIYAFFLTTAVLLYYWLAADHTVSEATQRLAATVIGIALAFAGTGLISLRARHRIAAPQAA
jgi:uncharacterized membrane protein YccC